MTRLCLLHAAGLIVDLETAITRQSPRCFNGYQNTKGISFTGLTPFVGNQRVAVGSKRLLGVVTLMDMMKTGSRKTRSPWPAWLIWSLAVWRLAKAGSSALALGALFLLPGSCLAAEPLMPAPLRSNASSLAGATIAGSS